MISTAKATQTLAYEFGLVPFTPPSSYRIALSTTPITLNASGKGVGYTEPTNPGYARIVVANNTSNWGVVDGEVTNKTQQAFPLFTGDPTGSDDTATHWFISEYAAGDVNDCAIYFGELTNPRPLVAESEIVLKVGSIHIKRENKEDESE